MNINDQKGTVTWDGGIEGWRNNKVSDIAEDPSTTVWDTLILRRPLVPLPLPRLGLHFFSGHLLKRLFSYFALAL